MCPIKTENMAINVPREEGDFWRKMAANLGVKSRADLQKNLLMAALEKLNARAAQELRDIRESHKGKPLKPIIATFLLVLFCGTIFSHDNLRRPPRRVRNELEIAEVSA